MTDAEWDKLISSLDAWDNREDLTVMYRRFLEAPYQRAVVSLHGIFPKIQKRELTKFEQERKIKQEEEEKKAAIQAEEDIKMLAEAKAKREAEARTPGMAAKSGKVDAKKNMREEQALKDFEKKEAELNVKAE